MSRVVGSANRSATALASAVAGAPRATVAVFLVATLAFASLLPQLALVNSEDMWLPEGLRTDAYHELAQSLGSTEYVGVLAESPDGNIVDASDLVELLRLEDRALGDPSIAEAFRFPRDPGANAVSLGDVIAEADAVLEHRRDVFEGLAARLNATLAAAAPGELRPADHAAWTAALLGAIRERESALRGPAPHALLEALLPELEVALLSGTDAPYKARAVELLLACTDFAIWSEGAHPLDPQDPLIAGLRAVLVAVSAAVSSNASAPVKSEALALLARALASAKTSLELPPVDAERLGGLFLNLSEGFAPGADATSAGRYAAAASQLLDAWLAGDALLAIADPQAAAGLARMSDNLSAVLGSTAPPATRAGAVEVVRRLFELAGAMGDRGLDLSVPQSNITFNAYAEALNENASVLLDAGATLARKRQAAAALSNRTVSFILINQNLSERGIFTDQASFERLMTMLYWLDDTFRGLVDVLGAPADATVLDHAALMVGAELVDVLNTSAVPPHFINLTIAAKLETALAALADAVAASPAGPEPLAMERAAAAVLRSFDFESAAPFSRDEENVVVAAQLSLAAVSALLLGGDPAPVKAEAAAVAQAGFALAARAPLTRTNAAAARALLTVAEREGVALDQMVQVGQNPALFARLSRATLAVFADGLASPDGALSGTDPALVVPLAGSLRPAADLLASGAVSAAVKDLFSAQVIEGAQLAARHLDFDPAPALPANRTQAAARVEALGDAGVSRTLGVLVGSVQSVSAAPRTVDALDARVQPFVANVSRYHPTLERELEELLGPRALRLLPTVFSSSGEQVTAEGTVVLFLFNGSLDRATLGARESSLRDLARDSASPAVSMKAFGYGLMWYDTQREMDLSVVLFALTMLAVMGIALWAIYRSPFEVLLTLALLGFTVVWVLGTAALLGIAINPVTQVIPVLLIGLAEDYAVHLIVGYRRHRGVGTVPGRAALAAVVGIGGVLLVATVTNGLSFLSFGGSDIALIKDLGTLMALGLLYAFLMTITFVPAALVWRDRRRGPAAASAGDPGLAAEPNGIPVPRPSKVERALRTTVETSVRHPWTTLLFVALLTGASALGATTLATTFSYDQITAKDLEVVRTLNFEQDHYSASIQRVFIVVDGPVTQPAVFLEIRAIADRAYLDPYVVRVGDRAGVTSIATLCEDLWRAVQLEGESAPGSTPAFAAAFRAADADGDGLLSAADNLTIARIDAVVVALLADPLSVAQELVHRGSAGFDRAVLRVEAVRAVEHGDELMRALEEDAAPLRTGPASAFVTGVTVTGLPLLNREVMEAVQESGWQSVIATVVLALVVLSVFFFIAFRSIALGPLTIAPTLIAVAWTLGAMVVLGLSLNMMTVMIATTTVGMGDLYAIHISYSFYKELRRHKDPLKAADAMVHEAGAPLLEASATTALGFLILVLAPVPVVQQYGLIFALSIVFAFVYSIVVMPVLVLLYARATGRIGSDAAAA